jgi:BirA family transcriptional regulator, biotin operon repressor / biotin---[acetyl-CoA-carboxylase] ligase
LKSINNTLFIGKVFHYLEAATSTNDIVQNLLLDGQKTDKTSRNTEGVVVCTFNQTAGRGQYGNTWISEPNSNIALSIVLKPHFLPIQEQFYLNKAIALAVSDVVAQNTEGVTIKWANDIFIYDKKVSGILIQNTLSQNMIDTSIVGIGINVNQLQFEGLPHATSLKCETGKVHDLWHIVENLCQAVEQRYLQLKSRKYADLDAEYLSKLYRYGADALYQYPNGTYFQGKIVGISDTGKLMIDSKAGLEYFDIKEVKFVL